MMPRVIQSSSWRSRASPRNSEPRYGMLSARSASPSPATVTVIGDGPAGAADSTEASGTSAPSASMTRIRWCSESSPPRATASAASADGNPASISRRKCPRYPRRQSRSCSAALAPAGSTGRRASATTERPSADVLRRPSADIGNSTPIPAPVATVGPNGSGHLLVAADPRSGLVADGKAARPLGLGREVVDCIAQRSGTLGGRVCRNKWPQRLPGDHLKGAAARSSVQKVLLLPVVLEGDLSDLPGLIFRHLAVLRPLKIAGALALGPGQLFAHENPLRFRHSAPRSGEVTTQGRRRKASRGLHRTRHKRLP